MTSWGALGKIFTRDAYAGGPFDRVLFIQGVFIGLLIDNENKILIASWRGTKNPKDFLIDAEAADFTDTGVYGKLPYGFWIGAEAIYPILRALVGPGWTILFGGHSLGAVRAAYMAAIFARYGVIISLLFDQGRPNTAFDDELAKFLEPIPIKLSLHNDDDPIGHMPPLARQSTLVTQVSIPRPKPPTPLEALIYPYVWPLGDHDSDLYLQASLQITPQQITVAPATFRSDTHMNTSNPPSTPVVSTVAHLNAAQKLLAGLAALKAEFLSVFGIVAQVQQQALPLEVAAAEIGATAAGAGGADVLIGEAGAAAGSLNAGIIAAQAPITPTSAAAALESLETTTQAVQQAITTATGKPASASVVAAEGALGAAATLAATAGSKPSAAP